MIKRTAAVWSPAAKATAGCAMPWKLRKRGKTTGLGLMMKGHLRENTKEARSKDPTRLKPGFFDTRGFQ